MGISNNPFFRLGVSLTDSRRQIAAKAEERAFFDSDEIVDECLNTLLNSSKRLAAEMDWLFGADSEEIKKASESLQQGKMISTDGLSSISELNAVMYNLESEQELDCLAVGYYAIELDELFESLDPAELTDQINLQRKEAGFSDVLVNDVTNELNRKREDIRRLLTLKTDSLTDTAFIQYASIVAQKYIKNLYYKAGVVLCDVISQYELRMQSKIDEITENIETICEKIKKSGVNDLRGDNFGELYSEIQKWHDLTTPVRLYSGKIEVESQQIANVGYILRDLCLYLNNEMKCTKEAILLNAYVLGFFQFVHSIRSQFEKDGYTLNINIDRKLETSEIETLIKSFDDKAKKTSNTEMPSDVVAFVKLFQTTDKKVYDSSMDKDSICMVRLSLFFRAREVAIILQNKYHQSYFAQYILEALIEESVSIPIKASTYENRIKLAETIGRLKEDLQVLKRSFNYSSIAIPTVIGSGSDLKPEVKITSTPVSKNEPLDKHYAVPDSKNGIKDKMVYIAIAVGGVAFIAILIIVVCFFAGKDTAGEKTNEYTTQYNGYYSGSSSSAYQYGNDNASYYFSFHDYFAEEEASSIKASMDSVNEDIDDLESELNQLESDLDHYKRQYEITGNDYYRRMHNSTLDEYNKKYAEYEEKIDDYNDLVDEYNAAIR